MDLLVTGVIRSAHGLDGSCKVESSSGEVEHFARLSEVFLRAGKDPGDAGKRFEIETVSGNAQCLLVKFKGVDTPEQAKKLAGLEILVPRDKACPLEAGEYYVNDLCQCVLVHKGTPVGTITNVLEGGAGDLLEVTLTEGSVPEETDAKAKASGNKTCLVPFRKEFVGKVDLKARTVELTHRWILE